MHEAMATIYSNNIFAESEDFNFFKSNKYFLKKINRAMAQNKFWKRKDVNEMKMKRNNLSLQLTTIES